MLSLNRIGVAQILSAMRECMHTRRSGPLRLLMAEAAFLSGRFDLALQGYQNLAEDPKLQPRAQLMSDWINFHRGDFSIGWPRYPGAEFEEPSLPLTETQKESVRVSDPRQPDELTTSLGLQRWTGSGEPSPPLLVWFNFKNSLGGEILVSRLISTFQARYQVPLVLACNPRSVALLRVSFPQCCVVDNTGDLAGLAGSCKQYVLARDLLKLLVKRESDFADISRERMTVPSATEANPRRISRPKVAISWRTTNHAQGRFRNLPINPFAKILARHDIEWHVAQHGEIERDVAAFRKLAPSATIHLNTLHPTGDLSKLATELTAMDAVVTIDNTLLHLAGSLGLPTLAMISVPGYWAWPCQGQGSRWYESVSILRQQKPGDWSNVLSDLEDALTRLIHSQEKHKASRPNQELNQRDSQPSSAF